MLHTSKRHYPPLNRLIIIGSGMATARLLEKLVELKHSYQILVIGEERQPSYNRVLLSSLLAKDKTEEDLPLLDESWYQKHGIELCLGSSVVDIDTANKIITTGSNTKHSYDSLVFATGSKALIPDIAGSDLKGVMGFRDQRDVKAMTQMAQKAAQQNQSGHAIVVGGGLLGLEAAHGLNSLGMKVTLIHRNKWLMNRQLDKTAGDILQKQLEARGINFVIGASPTNIEGKHNFESLELSNGALLSGDLLVFAAGIQPNCQIAQSAGLKTDKAICIDDQMRTSAEGIYALGECAELNGQLFGLVAPVWEQAEVLAEVLCGETQNSYSYQEAPTQLKVSGIDLFSAGDIAKAEAEDCEDIVLSLPEQGLYRRLFIRNNQLKAVVLLGNRANSSWYSKLIKNQTNICEIRPWLMFGEDFLPEELSAKHIAFDSVNVTNLNRNQYSDTASLHAA